MQLLDDMRAALQDEKSMFAAQLLKEDISRLERMLALAKAHSDPSAFAKQAMVLGWTANDMRTFELNPELAAFLDLAYRHVHPGSGGEVNNLAIDRAWAALHKRRIDLLVGCLSRPRLD
jgi:hypothetical protein